MHKQVPILSNAVDIDDVVCLSNGYFSGVGGEGQGRHLVRLLSKLS